MDFLPASTLSRRVINLYWVSTDKDLMIDSWNGKLSKRSFSYPMEIYHIARKINNV